LESLTTEYEQEVFLLKSFLVNCLSGYKRGIAHRFLFNDFSHVDDRESAYVWQILSLIFLPLYFIGALFYVFLFGVSIGSRATNTWLLGSFVSFAQEMLILQPVKIWLKWIIVSSMASRSLRIWHASLRDHAKHVMLRQKGLMKTANDFIHHFNPACRAARSFPHLVASRYLISLSDFDLPAHRLIRMESKLKKALRMLFGLTFIGFFVILMLPDLLQDIAMDVIGTLGANMTILGLASVSKWIAIGLSGLLIVVLLVREEFSRHEISKNQKFIIPPIGEEDPDKGENSKHAVQKDSSIKGSKTRMGFVIANSHQLVSKTSKRRYVQVVSNDCAISDVV